MVAWLKGAGSERASARLQMSSEQRPLPPVQPHAGAAALPLALLGEMLTGRMASVLRVAGLMAHRMMLVGGEGGGA